MAGYEDHLDINKFYENSTLKSTDILRQSRFVGVLTTPSIISLPEDKLTWNLTKVKCAGFELGVGNKEVDMMPRYYFKNYVYDDLSVSYIETCDLQIRKLFVDWMDKCLSVKGYVRNYFDDVKSPHFEVFPLSGRGDVVNTENFYDIVPYKIDSLEYDTSSSDDQLVHTTVFFKYLRHDIK